MPSSRNPIHLPPDDIVGEIGELRDTIDRSSRRIYELSKVLYDRMRRSPGANREIYITYSNVWIRFAGMVQQGLQRSRQGDRVLRLLPETPERTPEVKIPEPMPERVQNAPASPLEDFIELYGEEIVHDAAEPSRE
jgi:hypothetical protein